jgi:P4 family phage/plasmid primase-like protien
MAIHEQLIPSNIPCFPCALLWDPKKNQYRKVPRIPKDVSWFDVARNPDNYSLDWSSGVVGVPIPANVMIVDLDHYKGVTTQQVDDALGVPLDWAAALIQNTVSGGAHYAFYVQSEVSNGSDKLGVKGFDIRAHGKGFICTGEGYEQVNLGVLRFTSPSSLPVLPAAAVELLKPFESQPRVERVLNTNDEDVVAALKAIPPNCCRKEWLDVGMALKDGYFDDDSKGLYLYERWSSGELSEVETPDNYVDFRVALDWNSFKDEGAIRINTLFHIAKQYGYVSKKPKNIDTTGVFSNQAEFDSMVGNIRRDGSDITRIEDLALRIKNGGFTELQEALLLTELKSTLQDHGIKDKGLERQLSSMFTPTKPAPVEGHYSTSDPHNATVFLNKHFPDNTLVKHAGEFYHFNGKVWKKLQEDELKGLITADMSLQDIQESRVMAAYRTASRLVQEIEADERELPANKIVFNNGILDLETGAVSAHTKEYFNTVMREYDFKPSPCPTWERFLDQITEGDEQKKALLQEWFGYLLTKDYSHQKLMFFIGAPRSGKGTLARVLEALVGPDNFTGGSLSSFVKDSFLDSLRSKPVMFIGDAQKKVSSRIINETVELLKSITGNDAVSFDRKYLSGLSVRLPTRITIAANNVPSLFDDSGALSSRLLLVTFNRSFLGEEDLELFDKLKAEISGIATWAIIGLQRLRKTAIFTTPNSVRAELNFIKDWYSPINKFIKECCSATPGGFTQQSDLNEAYMAWCSENSERPLAMKSMIGSVKDSMRGQGVSYVELAGQYGFRGLKLNKDEIEGPFK